MAESTILTYLLAILSGLAGGLVFTPLVRGFARRLDFVDRPDGGRKNHAVPVALGGGLAVFVATALAVAVAFTYAAVRGEPLLTEEIALYAGLAVAAALTVALGIVDDLFTLRGRWKLLGQVVIALLLVGVGLRMERFSTFGVTWELGALAIPFTVFWLLGAINAVNLIDGIDGLASSVGAVLCLTVAAINALQGAVFPATLMLALAGAQLGFLRYNFAPASIYLGDAGSMLIGLLVGAIAVLTSAKSPAAVAMAVPLAVWSIPILDSAAAILRRKLTGRSVFAADRGHLHHSLLVRGWSVRQASMFIALICATTCLSAVVAVVYRMEWIALVVVAGVMVFLISTRTFGHIEFALLRDRFRGVGLSGDASAGKRESCIRLQGSRGWEKLWLAIIESAEDYRLIKVKLAINIPRMHEAFYATWESSALRGADLDRAWRATHPLLVDGQLVGSLDLTGEVDPGSSTLSQMVQVLDFLEPIEEDVRHICGSIEFNHDSVRLRRSAVLRADSGGAPALGRAAAGPTPSAAQS